jgi:hypothetical protein
LVVPGAYTLYWPACATPSGIDIDVVDTSKLSDMLVIIPFVAVKIVKAPCFKDPLAPSVPETV